LGNASCWSFPHWQLPASRGLLNREPKVAVLTQERIRPGGPGSGASSVQEFEFAAMRAGVSTLLVEYKRPWENVAGERLEIEIVVEP
jgi:predicted secreted protein